MPEDARESVVPTHSAIGERAPTSYSGAAARPRSESVSQPEQIGGLQLPRSSATSDAHDRRLVAAHASARSDTQTGALLRARSNGHPEPALRGRRREGHALHRLLATVRAGQSRVLVLRGESGAGKSALLEYLVGRASECRVVRAAGVESEMDLAYAGLHRVCAPVLELRERLPAPQRDALATVFGLNAGPI